MWRDPIVEEIRKIREDYAARFDFDLDAICRHARAEERKNPEGLVTLPPRPAVRPGERGVVERETGGAAG
ncbi:MAG: hypothetical protein WD066_09870 [Planctomycetaceae bacterium]